MAGGVSANTGLRDAFHDHAARYGWKIHIPKFAFTTDNAAMIAMVAKLKFDRGEFTDLSVSATSRYDIEESFKKEVVIKDK